MEQNTDELFASLGGSLMKDLWDDLQVGEDDLKADGMGWSLEQLERELAHLEEPPPQSESSAVLPPTSQPPGLSAASMVVSHAQEKQSVMMDTTTTTTTQAPADAWSESLQKFTALSLEKDFLAADSARKQQQSTAPPPPGLENVFENAQDYDVSEQVQLMDKPPPGLGVQPARPPPGLATGEQAGAAPIAAKEEPIQEPTTVLKKEQPTPPKAPAVQKQKPLPPRQQKQPSQQQQPTVLLRRPQQPPPMQQQQPMVMQPPPPAPMQQQPPPPPRQPNMAWQTPPPQMQPPPPTMRVYCQSHPSAPPIPATVLESSYMKARDISYVLHSMLKPVLLMGTLSSDYHVELLSKHYMQQQGVVKPAAKQHLESSKTTTVSLKSKEWMEKHSTLGHVSKTDVTRPRALIATTTLSKEQLMEDDAAKKQQKQRATLWKSRLYIDQAYQAYVNIVRLWKEGGRGRMPPQEIQPHLMRLYKYLGISTATSAAQEPTVDSNALGIILKLSKGKVLVARVLEQALLPPHVVQALLPAVFEIMLPTSSSSDEAKNAENRLMGACARVLQTLPNLTSACILQSLQQFLNSPEVALDTTLRMECIHALLQRGSNMAASDPDFATQHWNAMEQEFLKLMS